ncbi:hypothetical protein F6X40_30435 [Paraburkholderia sp. UCT31]|uniref:hypothetical protein n=1 Tax=Paraburkholderia sp. UCT31 TaxID=2615209 RepID=UPI0016556FFD|nr:hypothetical protein [Paraburkholderia sp. UCT31]MBC8740935.1 hypothetical protein [Paraburkholderia sp. UCT31]
MATSVRNLGIYDLLAPDFLAGPTFPDHIDKYLSILAVSSLPRASDDDGVLYTGTIYFLTGLGDPPPVTQRKDPSGALFEWSDVNFQFVFLTELYNIERDAAALERCSDHDEIYAGKYGTGPCYCPHCIRIRMPTDKDISHP